MKRFAFAVALLIATCAGAAAWWQSVSQNSIDAISSPVLTYKASATSSASTAAVTYSIDIGTASADRLIIIAVDVQNGNAITSLTVNGTGLVNDVIQNSASVWSGLVTTGSGVQNVVLTVTSGGFLERDIHLWTATGLNSNVVKNTGTVNTSNDGSINITSGDFLIATVLSTLGTFSSSTQTPSNTYVVGGLNGRAADWNPTTSTSATFNVHFGAVVNAAFASYR